MTLVSDHRRRRIVWGHEGHDTATLDGFFNELGDAHPPASRPSRWTCPPGYAKSVARPGHAPTAVICYAAFHVVALVTKAPDKVRRDPWNDLRRLRRQGGALWRACTLKEALRAVLAGDLNEADGAQLLDRLCSEALRSGLKPFVTVAQTIRRHRAGIRAAVRLGITNARHEGLNRRVRMIVNRAYGFHSARATLALVMPTVGPIDHALPHERASVPLTRPTSMPRAQLCVP